MMTTTSTTYKVFTMLVLMNKWMLVSAFGSLPYRHVHGHGHGHRKSNYAYDAPAKTAFTGTAWTTVRPRPLVKLQEAGVYIPPQRISDGQDTDSTSSNISSSTSTSISASSPRDCSWDDFKDGIYNCVDFATRANSKHTISNSIMKRKMAVAYSNTVEAQRDYQNESSRTSKSKPIAIKPPASLSVRDYAELEQNLLLHQNQASLKTSPFLEDISNGESLYHSDLRKSFDSGKDVIYGTIDSLTAKKGKKGNSLTYLTFNLNDEGSVASLFPNTHEECKVTTKQSMNRDETVAIVADGLTSTNSGKRLKANFEQRRKCRQERERREAAVNGIKQTLVSDL